MSAANDFYYAVGAAIGEGKDAKDIKQMVVDAYVQQMEERARHGTEELKKWQER